MEIHFIAQNGVQLDPIRMGYGANATTSTPVLYRTRDALGHVLQTVQRNPAALQFNPSNVPLIVRGCFHFSGKDDYLLVITAPQQPFSLTSAPFTITGTPDKRLLGFSAGGFANPALSSNSPFQVSGTCTFTLRTVKDPKPIATAQVPLELYFFLGARTPVMAEHYHDLLKLALPSYSLVQGLALNNVEAVILRNVTEKIWGLGLDGVRCYDVSRGASYHVAFLGNSGRFNLQTFMTKVLPLCNCFDLAFLAKSLFESLGLQRINNATTNVVTARITLDKPWGYVNRGPLFGWDQHPSRFCNSPFWWKYRKMMISPWLITATKSPFREYFGCHCYTLVSSRARAGTELVVDACQASLNVNTTVLHAGTETRQQFYANAIARDGLHSETIANKTVVSSDRPLTGIII